MYSDWVWQLAFGIIVIWNVVLSFIIWKDRQFLTKLFPKTGERDIRKKFEEILQTINGFSLKLSSLDKGLESLEKDSLGHIQKVKLLRYNPYEDVGGDQSFTVALLDKKGNGIVATSLHTRSGTRVFAKQVIDGKGGKHDFSNEEQQVIKDALDL